MKGKVFVKRRYVAFVAACIMATTVTTGALAATKKTDAAIQSAGIALYLDDYDYETNDKKTELEALVQNNVKATKVDVKSEEETKKDNLSVYDTIAITKVDNYVNVREKSNTDSEVVGVIYDKCAATILAEEGDWYKIESGNVTGYVNKQYFVTGDEARELATQCGYVKATVTTTTLNVREGQGTDDEIVAQIPEGDEYDVIEYGDGWVYLNVDEMTMGWVSDEFVDIQIKYNTALTLEEEQAKIAEEERLAAEAAEAERLAAEEKEKEEAAKAAYDDEEDEVTYTQSNETQTTTTYSEPETEAAYVEPETEASAPAVSSSGVTGADVVAYASQFVGNPYVYGGSSLTNGTDCSGFTMSVYAHFGYSLPHSSGAQSGCGTRVALSDIQPGDILCYSGHVAIYAGNGQIVHASTPETGITYGNAFSNSPYAAVRIIN